MVILAGCGSRQGRQVVDNQHYPNDTAKAVIAFTEYEHDFGKVTAGEEAGYVFTFMNKGTSDLVIISAKASCGCTLPRYDRKPLAPGKTGSLEVLFNTTGRHGPQSKTITVKSNARNPVVILRITAEVTD